MTIIDISNMTFSYENGYENIFEGVDLHLDTDWKLGLIGRNGRGKTTFLKILQGEFVYIGNISTTVSFDYFPFEVPDKKKTTMEIIESIYPDFIEWELNRELNLLTVSEDVFDRPFVTLSLGEQTKILLATLFLKPNNFLLIDEPTDHLDVDARKIVSQYMKSKKGFIVVSHDQEFLDNAIDHVLSINRTNIELVKGNFSSWWKNKEMNDQMEIEHNERLRGEIKRLTEASRRTSEWSDKVEKSKNGSGGDKGFISHKATKMMKRSKTIEARAEKSIEEKKRLLKNIDESKKLVLKPLAHHKHTLLCASDLSILFDHKKITNNIQFTVNQGDRLSLVGKNGSGKSSIIKLILGENISFLGELNIASELKISYLPQDSSFLKGNMRGFIQSSGIEESIFKTTLNQLGFSKEQYDRDLSELSSGQKKKLLLAKSLCEEAHLYIWDEPLNFIDILSRKQIEELILRVKPTMLFVEHDVAFTEKIATNTVFL